MPSLPIAVASIISLSLAAPLTTLPSELHATVCVPCLIGVAEGVAQRRLAAAAFGQVGAQLDRTASLHQSHRPHCLHRQYKVERRLAGLFGGFGNGQTECRRETTRLEKRDMCAIGKLGVDRSGEGLFAAAAQAAGSVERRCQCVATAAFVNFELIIAVFRTQFVDANAQRLRFGDGKTEQLDIFCLLDQLHNCQQWRRLKGDSLCRGGTGQGCAAAIHFDFEHGQQTHVAIALRID